jgi:ketosteroid isomerase-like protein
MKKILLAAGSLAFILIACKDADNTSGNSQAATNTEHSKEIYRALETGDVSKLDSIIAPDFVNHESGEMQGRDSAKAMIGDVHNHFDNLKFDLVSEATASNDYHFALVHMTGTAKDNSMGMPAGTKVDRSGVDVVRIKDGKAVEHWSFEDPKAMMEMMQHMPPGSMDMPKTDTTKKM